VMFRKRSLGFPLAVAMIGIGLSLTACGYEHYASGSSASAGHIPSVVITHDHPRLGRILVDNVGYTLYFSDQEKDGGIYCTKSCLRLWTPVAIPENAPVRAEIDGLGTLDRSDNGQDQLTYQGKPLYTFTLDTGVGDIKGHQAEEQFDGMRFVWHAVVLGEVPGGGEPVNGDGGFGL
jgi:predicted lipoprotein with Yx(FWY)xxD motif